MEFYQLVQNRTNETIPVITTYDPTLTIEKKGVAELAADAKALDGLADVRDQEIFDFDQAVRAEFAGYLGIRLLGVKVPALIEAFLGDGDPLLESLSDVYAVTPRTTESALERGRALRPVWVKANAQRGALVPPEPPITRNGAGIAQLDALMGAQPALEQTIKTAAQAVRAARLALASAAGALDALNKRFYKALSADADSGSALENALGGITTEGQNMPPTLSIAKVLQSGADQLHVLASFDAGTLDATMTNTVEWQVVGVDADFTHNKPAAAGGTEIGPFTVGQTVRLRTRVANANGTTTGSVRSITIAPPIV